MKNLIKKILRESKFDNTMETQRMVDDITDHINYIYQMMNYGGLSDEEYNDALSEFNELCMRLEELGFYYDENSMDSFPIGS